MSVRRVVGAERLAGSAGTTRRARSIGTLAGLAVAVLLAGACAAPASPAPTPTASTTSTTSTTSTSVPATPDAGLCLKTLFGNPSAPVGDLTALQYEQWNGEYGAGANFKVYVDPDCAIPWPVSYDLNTAATAHGPVVPLPPGAAGWWEVPDYNTRAAALFQGSILAEAGAACAAVFGNDPDLQIQFSYVAIGLDEPNTIPSDLWTCHAEDPTTNIWYPLP